MSCENTVVLSLVLDIFSFFNSVFTASGVALGEPLICSCQSGVTACGIAAAAEMLGKEEISVYLVSSSVMLLSVFFYKWILI